MIYSVSYRLHAADSGRLDCPTDVEAALEGAVSRAGLTEVGRTRHRFEPQGLSAVVLLSESHLAIHTWPESATAYATLTSCRELDDATVQAIGSLLAEHLGAEAVTSRMVRL